jgi:hypothetical protein
MTLILQQRNLEKIIKVHFSDKNARNGQKSTCFVPGIMKKRMADSKICSVARCKLKNPLDNKSGNFSVIDCNDWIEVIAETLDS